MQYQQEQFVNAAQEHQRVAYEQVEISAAFATNRTAAQMTSRFRDIENNVDGEFQASEARIIVRKYFRVSSGARSSATLSSSRSYSRDDAEKHSQSRGGLLVKKK